MKSVAVFCGTSQSVAARYSDLAREVGVTIAKKRMRLVYGGNGAGMTGALADGAMSAGGKVTGVIPAPLFMFANRRIDDLRFVSTMHSRKSVMAESSDAFVALPGGFGTLDEVYELATWRQVGLHGKPIAYFNFEGFFDPLMEWQRRAHKEGFVTEFGMSVIQVLSTTKDLEAWLDSVPALGSWIAPQRTLSKWIKKLPGLR